MKNIKSILSSAKAELSNTGSPSSALDAELLLAYALGASREKIIGYPELEISGEEAKAFNALVKRRIAREPMAHILGRREFWGREFKVNKYTLDPRPDSETLIEAALELFPLDKQLNILDFGTGTGCLLLTLLAEFPNAKGVGVDISSDALAVAKGNSCNLGLANRAEFIVSSWGDKVQGKYDLIISNPPYIRSSDISCLEPEVSKYEPCGALDGGMSGLQCYEDLAPQIATLISNDGFVVLEFGMGQHEDVKDIMENIGLAFVDFKQDLAGINRCAVFSASAD
ncbi:MAG: Methylase of polypeptide chain release factor [Rickettsiaceae bacterium]|jgi:release factor glutamine methyltransferase|nr:Methylase of polypeptide chain release factor [Rickettsiaceae bacterium]